MITNSIILVTLITGSVTNLTGFVVEPVFSWRKVEECDVCKHIKDCVMLKHPEWLIHCGVDHHKCECKLEKYFTGYWNIKSGNTAQ